MASSLDTQVITAPQNEPVFIGDTLVTPTGGAQGTLADKLASGGGATGATGPTGSGATGATGPTGSGGGGGGGNSITLAAGTDLAAGTAVAINSSGDATQTWGAGPVFGSTTVVAEGVNIYWGILQLSAGAFVAFSRGANGTGITPGTISGNSITLGTFFSDAEISNFLSPPPAGPVQVNASGFQTGNAAALSSTSFAITYQDPSNSNEWYVKVYSISGGVITAGTAVNISADPTTIIGSSVQLVALSSTSLVFVWVGAGNSNAVAISVTGLVPTVQLSPVTWASVNACSVATLSSTKVVITYTNSTNSGFLTAVIGTVSTGSISLGTPVAQSTYAPYAFGGGPNQPLVLASGLFVQTWAYSDSDTLLALAAAYTVSGSTITQGAPTIIGYNTAATVGNVSDAPVYAAGLSASTFVVSLGSLDMATRIGTVSGTTISLSSDFSPPSVPIPVTNTLFGALPNCLVGLSSTAFMLADTASTVYEGSTAPLASPGITHPADGQYVLGPVTSTQALAAFIDPQTNFVVRLVNYEAPNPSGPVGFVASAVTSGDPATVIFSGLTGGLSGLTPGDEYYVSGDGTLTTNNTGHRGGVAVSSTQLLINL